MARATRSTTAIVEKHEDENQDPSGTPPPVTAKPSKTVNKKRKRTQGTDSDDLPSAKQNKTNEEEETPEKGEDVLLLQQDPAHLPLAGDLPMADEDAQKILEILEVADTQGLLDRVFPVEDARLPKLPSSSPSSSKTTSDSYSLRTLLKESKDHPLRVYRSVIKQLYPISSQPRARISPPAAHQLRFCQLALSLIEQASRRTIDVLSLKPEHILPVKGEEDDTEKDVDTRRRKYALVQRLPTGDLWTSLDSDLTGSDTKPLSQLGTGHAELVAVLPSSSSSKPIPTLGELHADKKVQTKYKPPTTRHVSCGSYLDYGPYASFAPAFDSDGADVGRIGLSDVLWRRHVKGKAREKARILGDRLRSKLALRAADVMEIDEVVEADPAEVKDAGLRKEAGKRRELLEKLFAPEESEALQEVLDALECEENVGEMLLHNAKALVQLQELQRERLQSENGGSKDVEVGSEEWNLAQMIMDSLTLLASLRPRKLDGTVSATLPPVSVLRVLQQTLPSEASQGWHGTLSESRGLAVRDDTTLRVKGPLENVQSLITATAPTAMSSASTTQTPAPPYPSNYTYAAFQQHYRTVPTQNQGYLGSAYSQTAATPQPQNAQTPYQTQTQYGGSNQYSYSAWLQSQAAAGSLVGTPTPGSRKGTPGPQPTTAATSTLANSTYLPYTSALAATTSATPSRAVANTISAKPATNGWSTSAVTPGTPSPIANVYTLPPHFRASGLAAPSSPLPSPAVLASASQNYLSGYQAAATTGPSTNA
ncbi:hypothetical protein ACEPAG_1057 [Sanghuangporus baumii]